MADSADRQVHQLRQEDRVAVAARGVPRCTVCHAALPWIVDADPQQFDGGVDADMPVLVDFWADRLVGAVPETQLRQWLEPHLTAHSTPSS